MDLYDLFEKALIKIEYNLDKPLDLDVISMEFNISKFYFHRIFSAFMGVSLSNYILSRRLNASLALIADQKYSLTDVSYSLNFGTQSSFSRAFKCQYGFPPSKLKLSTLNLEPTPIPEVIRRPFKNLNGDVITSFNLMGFDGIKLIGLVFEINLAIDDYKHKIRSYVKELVEVSGVSIECKLFLIYSNCQPDSPEFRVLFGVPLDSLPYNQIQNLRNHYDNVFDVEVPPMYCARFDYQGDLLDIGDVFKTDFARVLRISRLELSETGIELIQEFNSIEDLMDIYHVLVPIKKCP